LEAFERRVPDPGKGRANVALIVAAVAFVAVGIALEAVFLPKTSSSAGSRTTTPSETVMTAVNRWVSDFSSRNVTALGNFYVPNATVIWTGNAAGLTGTYDGQNNIRILYGSTIGKETSLNASAADYAQKNITPFDANVTFTLNTSGNSSEVGKVIIQANVSQDWNYTGGEWQIVKEDWNYATFDEQLAGCCSTTFPQWTALKEGQNPNLVSDKSFEWQAGPYLAVSVYAFLGAVVAVGLLTNGRRPGNLTS
jgi:hypothetical protein